MSTEIRASATIGFRRQSLLSKVGNCSSGPLPLFATCIAKLGQSTNLGVHHSHANTPNFARTDGPPGALSPPGLFVSYAYKCATSLMDAHELSEWCFDL